MEKSRIASREAKQNARIVDYRPLRPGEDYKEVDDSTVVLNDMTGAITVPLVVLTKAENTVHGEVNGADLTRVKRPISLAKAAGVFCIIVILAAAGYIAYDTWQDHNQVKSSTASAAR